MIFQNKFKFFSKITTLFIIIFFSCYMVAKVSFSKNSNQSIKLDVKKAVQSKILDVNFGNNKADIVVYFVDKKGLEKNWLKHSNTDYVAKIKYKKFEATKGQLIDLDFAKGKQIILVGVDNDKKDLKKEKNNIELDFAKAGASVVNVLPKGQNVNVLFSNKYIENKEFKQDSLLVEAYFGFNQKYYRFDKYITNKEEKEKRTVVNSIILDASENNEIKKLIKTKQNQLEGIFYIRELGNEPANVVYPETMADEIKKAFVGIKNTKVKVLNKKDIEKLGMNMLLGVAQGSVKEPKVVVVEYLGNPKQKTYDLALIGKGVCFDSGGLSLKPSQYMEGMKGDMLGAATILSSTLSMAKNGVKANIVAVAGLVENMPDGNAQKVGDIVKSMSGKTVEIIDTDAEGRLVLGDILYYAQTTYKPEYMIDIVTLTCVIMVALGLERAGIFTNNETLGNSIKKSGDKSGDKCWVMPMGEEYADAMKSQIADLRNLSSVRYAGSATAAAFLENFIDDNKKWAHIDIAGVDNATKNKPFCVADFASGFGLKLLNEFVKTEIEK